MAHNFPKISAPFGRATPKDRLVDISIFAKPWVQMFYDNNIKMYASEKVENYIKRCDEVLKNHVENPTLWENKEFGKSLELSIKKSSTLDDKIVDELTDAECRKGFTVTEKAIKLCGRGDLINKYKSVTESKTITLKSLKD